MMIWKSIKDNFLVVKRKTIRIWYLEQYTCIQVPYMHHRFHIKHFHWIKVSKGTLITLQLMLSICHQFIISTTNYMYMSCNTKIYIISDHSLKYFIQYMGLLVLKGGITRTHTFFLLKNYVVCMRYYLMHLK